MQVIINASYGGGLFFGDEQVEEYQRRKGIAVDKENLIWDWNLRFDPIMIDIVRNSGLPNCPYSDPKVRYVGKAQDPDEVSIHEYDGKESAYFSQRKATRKRLVAFDETEASLEECRSFIKELKQIFNLNQ